MYKINYYNPIKEEAKKLFTNDYIESDLENCDAVLIRSTNILDLEMPKNVLCIGRAGVGVNTIPYKKYGKEAFMEKEISAYERLKNKEEEGYILSLGGGVSDNTPLMEELKKDGVIIYLKREELDMLPFILKSGIPPFLDKNNLTSSFHELYERRDKIYSSYSSLTIELGRYGDKEKTAKLIIDRLKENGYV